MAEEKSKLIPFSKELEALIEADAKRCHRSFVRQVVAVLSTYYSFDNVEIDGAKLQMLGQIAGKSEKKTKVIEAAADTLRRKKKKKA